MNTMCFPKNMLGGKAGVHDAYGAQEALRSVSLRNAATIKRGHRGMKSPEL